MNIVIVKCGLCENEKTFSESDDDENPDMLKIDFFNGTLGFFCNECGNMNVIELRPQAKGRRLAKSIGRVG